MADNRVIAANRPNRVADSRFPTIEATRAMPPGSSTCGIRVALVGVVSDERRDRAFRRFCDGGLE
jgi:hypothetical protein